VQLSLAWDTARLTSDRRVPHGLSPAPSRRPAKLCTRFAVTAELQPPRASAVVSVLAALRASADVKLPRFSGHPDSEYCAWSVR
jgi:hypothetical protein